MRYKQVDLLEGQTSRPFLRDKQVDLFEGQTSLRLYLGTNGSTFLRDKLVNIFGAQKNHLFSDKHVDLF